MEALRRIGHQICLDVGENRIFAEIITDDGRNIGIQSFVVRNTGAERVSETDVSGAISIEQTGDSEARVVPEGQRVDKIVIDAAVDHIHAPKPCRGAHVNIIVVRYQIPALD